MGTEEIAEVGRTAESHRIGDLRDRLMRVLGRPQQVVASLQPPKSQPFRGRHVDKSKKMMEIAQRYAVFSGNRGQREVWIAEILLNICFDRAQTRMLDALIVRGLPIRFGIQRQGDEVHELLAELRSRRLVKPAALRRERGAEFGGDAAEAAREVEILEHRRTPRVEPALKGRAGKLDPKLTRPDVAMQLIGFVGVIEGAPPGPQN